MWDVIVRYVTRNTREGREFNKVKDELEGEVE
jgi:hypothetical protein